MMLPRDIFLVRPKRRYRESLVGYLYRFYSDNGLGVPREYGASVRGLYQGDARLKTDDLKITLGADSLVNRDWWLAEQSNIPCFSGRRPAWLQRHYYPIRYCPDCLRMTGFHLDLWTLPFAEACPEHRCALVSRCINCGVPLSWRLLSLGWRCPCGAYLMDATSPPASVWSIRLADELMKASGLDDRSEAEIIRDSSTEDAESLLQFYEFMNWAKVLRRRLRQRFSYVLGPDWSIALKPQSRIKIGAWEARLLFSGISKLRRFIRWNFRGQNGVLVEIQDARPLDDALNLLRKLKGNRYADDFCSMFECLFDELDPGIKHWPGVLLHPRFYGKDLLPTLTAFAQWWQALAKGIPVLKPESSPSSRVGFPGNHRAAMEILNSLLMAACRNEDVDRYVKLKSRWHLPEHMHRQFSPEEVLPAHAQYFGGLRASEQLFVRDLIDDVDGA